MFVKQQEIWYYKGGATLIYISKDCTVKVDVNIENEAIWMSA